MHSFVIALFASGVLAGPAAAVGGSRPAVEPAEETSVFLSNKADLGVQLGAGVSAFATELDKGTNPGMAWDLRGIYGRRQFIGAELGYNGAANDLKTTDGQTARLMTQRGEALVRLNLGMKNLGVHTFEGGDVIPYVAVGGGWGTMYAADNGGAKLDQVAGVNYQTTSTFHIPAAIGVDAIFAEHYLVGVRGNYSYEFANNVRTDVAKTDVQAWQAVGHVGVSF